MKSGDVPFGAAENHLMNRHPGLFSFALICGMTMQLAAPVTGVYGQAAPAAPVGNIDALKSSNSVAASAGQISAYVNGLVTQLGDPASSATARDALVKAATGATPSFLATYAGALNTGITPALQNQSDVVRLNAAIAIARVAEISDDAGLMPAVIALLNDKSPYVALWGFKAARDVLPAVLGNAAMKPDPLFSAILKSAATHGTGAIGSPIAIEAYDALTLNLSDAAKRPAPAAIKAVIPVVQQLLRQRADMYVKGLPPEPMAEQRATLFLSHATVWQQHNAKDKLASVQVMSDLANLGAQHFANAAAARPDLAPMIANVSGAIAVTPEAQPIQAKLVPATKINAGTAPNDVAAAVGAIVPALKTVGAFSAIQPPPTIAAPTGGTPPPSTAPTTAGALPATAAAVGP